MKQEGLVSRYTTAQYKRHKDSCNEAKIKNVLDRKFNEQNYRNVVVSDLTYVRVGTKWNYQTPVQYRKNNFKNFLYH